MNYVLLKYKVVVLIVYLSRNDGSSGVAREGQKPEGAAAPWKRSCPPLAPPPLSIANNFTDSSDILQHIGNLS